MKTQTISSKWLSSWLARVTSVLLVAIGIFIWLPHRTQVVEAEATLQSGMKMNVKCTLRSPWGWCQPDSLAQMDVNINGHAIPIDRASCDGVRPVKTGQPPIIVERDGFPEVILLGASGSNLKQANWMFLNYSLSQRELIAKNGRQVAYFAPQVLASQAVAPVRHDTASLATLSKPIPIAKLEENPPAPGQPGHFQPIK